MTSLTVGSQGVPLHGPDVEAVLCGLEKGEDDVSADAGVDVLWKELAWTTAILGVAAVVTEQRLVAWKPTRQSVRPNTLGCEWWRLAAWKTSRQSIRPKTAV